MTHEFKQTSDNTFIEHHYYLLYLSDCHIDINEFELLNLLKSGIENNSRNQITSLLIHRPSQFLQILEGNRDLVIDTFNRICKDCRHFNIHKIDSGIKKERLAHDFIEYRYQNLFTVQEYAPFFQEGFDASFLIKYKKMTFSFLKGSSQNCTSQ